MGKKILSFFILIVLFFSIFCNVYAEEIVVEGSSGNDGIMLTATLEDYTPNADGSYTLEYISHGTSSIREGSVVIPAEFWGSSPTYTSWCLFLTAGGGVPIMYASTDSTLNKFYLAMNESSPTYMGVLLTNSDFSVFDNCDLNCFVYDSTTATWTSVSPTKPGAYYYNTLPSGYLYQKNADVYYTSYYENTYNNSLFLKNIRNYLNNGTLEAYSAMSCCFYGTSPHLILLNDNTFKVALGTCYEGYTFDGGDNFVTVTDTICDSLLLYIYDMDENFDVYKYAMSFGALLSYIYPSSEYGAILELPFDTAFADDFFVDGHHYSFSFSVACRNIISKGGWSYDYYDTASFSADLTSYGSGGSVSGDINQDMEDSADKATEEAIKNQTEEIKKQHETSKGIWETIKEILSYINPFSENFFAYKLVELIYDAISSLLQFLFIPEDDFLANWFKSVNDEFSEQFGIIYYPVDVSISFLNSLSDTLTDSEPVINIPEFKLSFMGFSATLLKPFSYNFNSLLENETFSRVHNYYKIFVNLIFIVGLIRYATKIGVEIFGGIDDSIDIQINRKSDE